MTWSRSLFWCLLVQHANDVTLSSEIKNFSPPMLLGHVKRWRVDLDFNDEVIRVALLGHVKICRRPRLLSRGRVRMIDVTSCPRSPTSYTTAPVYSWAPKPKSRDMNIIMSVQIYMAREAFFYLNMIKAAKADLMLMVMFCNV